MSRWAAVELMRQQTCVSCQCHPEGDVSPPAPGPHPHRSLTSPLSPPPCPRLPLTIVQFLWPLLSVCPPLLSSPSNCVYISPSLVEVSLGGAVLLPKGAKAAGGGYP